MKTKCGLLLLLLGLAAAPARAADAITESFQKALFEEEANQNLDAAIKAYQTVIEATDAQRRLSATAVFRLGECYRKLGQTNAAAAQYQRLLRDYADQTNLVTLSRQNLAGLDVPVETAVIPTLSHAARQEQKRLLEEEIKLVEQQLDGIKKVGGPDALSQGTGFARVRELLALRRQLAALDIGPTATAPAGSADAGATDEEDKEIRRIQALIQNSPDLISGAGAGTVPTPLMVAAQKGHLAVARFLLAAKADVNAQRDGGTALSWAVGAGQKTMAELLLTNGANVNIQDKAGRSPLFSAVEKGFRSVAEVLLDHKADVHLKDNNGRTPLCAAAEAGHSELVELLLRRGADVNIQAGDGLTPLHLAAMKGREAVVGLLLAHKAVLDAKNTGGNTPLFLAVEQGHVNTADLLLKAEADARVKVGGTSLLRVAISRGQLDLLKLLLAQKPDLEATDDSGFTPLQYAVTRYNYSGAAESVLLLLEAGADPNRPFNAVGYSRMVPPNTTPQLDTTGCTPLVVASFIGNTAMVKSLLAHGAKVNAKSSDGMTALLYAVQKQSLPMLEVILAHKPDLQIRERSGFSALAMAVAMGESKIAEKLIQAGADVNSTTPESPANTVLQQAVQVRNKNLVELLVTNKANLNLTDKLGRTPLDIAQDQARSAQPGVREAFAEIAALLLKHGADEKFTLRSRIEVGRGARGVLSRVFMKGTNDWNRYTLLELIATAFAYPGNDPAKSLPFPDLSRVAIKRLGLKGEADSMFFVDVAAVLNSGDCTNAPWLEWGDLVDLPEQDHPVNEQWQGLSVPVREALIQCLKREVDIVIKGQSRKVILTPRFQPTGVGLQPMPMGGGGVPVFSPGGVPEAGSEAGPIRLGVFRLNEVLRGSGLLRVSSDLSRVRVKRIDPFTRKPAEWIVNLSPESSGEPPSAPTTMQIPGPGRRMRPVSDSGSDSATDLWLRDGDVIEVPEK